VKLFKSMFVDFPGVDNFMDDIEFMTGRRPFFYWRFCWRYL